MIVLHHYGYLHKGVSKVAFRVLLVKVRLYRKKEYRGSVSDIAALKSEADTLSVLTRLIVSFSTSIDLDF